MELSLTPQPNNTHHVVQKQETTGTDVVTSKDEAKHKVSKRNAARGRHKKKHGTSQIQPAPERGFLFCFVHADEKGALPANPTTPAGSGRTMR